MMKTKKYLLAIAVVLMGTAMVTSCSDDDEPSGPSYIVKEYSDGAYIVNAGNMAGKIDGSLTYIDYSSNTAAQKVFANANNGESLGSTPNDGLVYGSKIYVAVDQSNTIEVIDKATMKRVKQISTTTLMGNADGAEPRHLAAGGGEIFFSTYGGYVGRIDTTNYALSTKYKVGSYPEGLLYTASKLYVANSNYAKGDGNISEIDLNTGNVETYSVEGINNPQGFYYTPAGIMVLDWVYYDASWATKGANALYLLDGKDATKVADATSVAVYTESGATRSSQQVRYRIYILNAPYGGDVTYSVIDNYQGTSPKPLNIADADKVVSPAAISVDPVTSHVFVLSYVIGEYGYADYSSDGYVVEYDAEGKKLHEYKTGVGPTTMFFNAGYKTVLSE